MGLVMKGRVWVFGDDINSDLILPVVLLSAPRSEKVKHVFQANRPGWVEQVARGDILVAGRNFGMGSGRPTAQVLKDLGLACVLAESLNGLFLRNSVNYALPTLEVPGVANAFNEGDTACVDFDAATVTNPVTGTVLTSSPWPAFAQEILHAGGLIDYLDTKGLLHEVGWTPPDADGQR